MLIFIYIYVVVGLLFSIAFLLVGYKKIDESAKNAGWLLRLLWLPAAFALWPLLSWRWFNKGKTIN